MNNLITRSISGIVFAGLIIGALLLHHIPFVIVFAVIEVLTLWEFFKLVEKANASPLKYYGSIVGFIAFVLSYLSCIFPEYLKIVLVTVPLVLAIFVIELYRKKENPLLNVALTLLGLAYITLPLMLTNYIVFFTKQFDGSILLGVFILMWVYDSGAYFVGVSVGRNKLFERISPKKSWEGLIGGVLSVVGFAFILNKIIGTIAIYHWLAIGFIVVIFGTYGDLIESLLKRSVKVKDSGRAIPGHGGMLDRFDSILFVIPMVIVYLYLFVV